MLPSMKASYDRPLWPPGVEIAAQALDSFVDWCIDHPNDCILKQVEEYADGHKYVLTYLEEEGTVPDSFFTMKRGDTLEQAAARAKMKWPDADIQVQDAEDDETEDE